MSESLKKPYEISIWEDELVTLNEETSYYREKKIAIIGTDTMTAPTKVFSPVLNLNINGEKTLTFSLQYKYFDEAEGDFVLNPVTKYLVNERKVKLYYNDQWYDFIIKEKEENTEDYIYKYTAIDIFVNELARQGYDIALNEELGNNYGTAIELAEEVIKNTNWTIDKENSSLLKQYVAEPLYSGVVNGSLTVLNTDTNETVTIPSGTMVYIFSNYINNKNGNFVQFISFSDYTNWQIDDHNIIRSTNYRIIEPVIIDSDNNRIIKNNVNIITNIRTYYDNQAYRLVYKQKTLFDPITQECVDLYKANFFADTQEIYHYKTYDYGTSALVQSYITNGSNFNIDSQGGVLGWDGLVDVSGNQLSSVSYANSFGNSIPTFNQLAEAKSFLRIKFAGNKVNNSYVNAIHNSGFYDMASSIDSIARADEYAIRLRYGTSNNIDGKVPTSKPNSNTISAVVAFYTYTNKQIGGTTYKVKTFSGSDVIFNFSTINTIVNNSIDKGSFNSTYTNYLIDNVVQTPSLDYCYYNINDISKSNPYVWDPTQRKYIALSAANSFYNYFLGTAKALKTISKAELTSTTKRIGIFLYTSNANIVYYLQDAELFKVIRDKNNQIVLPNNAPEGYTNEIDNFYWKPYGEITKDEINIYHSLEGIAAENGMHESDIVKVYDDNCEKVLSVSEENSNCYNILQSICETFECWLKISVEHEPNGAIKLDSNYCPIKKIALKEFVGKENYAGFKYGINLNSITRNIDSNEFVSKLIVASLSSDYTNNGLLDISYADANPSGESIIYDLNYYVNQGLINNIEQYKKDLYNLNTQLRGLNNIYQPLIEEEIQVTMAYERAQALYGVNLSLLEEAQKDFQVNEEALQTALKEKLTYEQFVKKYGVNHNIFKSSEVADIVGNIIADNITLNSVGGIISTAESEYKDLSLKLYGAKEYNITITTSSTPVNGFYKTKIILSDYIPGITFILSGGNLATGKFISTMQEKEKEFNTANSPYTYVTISGMPTDKNKNKIYKVQYIQNGITYIVNELDTISIVEQANEIRGMTRRFKMVPTETYRTQFLGIKQQLKDLAERKQKLISQFENKYSNYIQEGTWSSDSYIDSNLYYFDALQVSQTSAKPKVSYTINVSEISEIDDYENYNFDIGDKTYVEDTDFFGYQQIHSLLTPHQEEVILSEIEWHLDEPEQNLITVQNYKTRFEDLFQRMSAAVIAAEFNENAYNRAAATLNMDGTIDPKTLALSMSKLGSMNYSLGEGVRSINGGFEFKNLIDPMKIMRFTSKGIEVSIDGGKLWEDIVTANGINTKQLRAGTIDTQQITIMDGGNTSFRWDKKGLSAYGYNEDGSYDLSTFVRFDQYGIYGIQKGETYVADNLEDVKSKAQFALTWDGFFIKNKYTDGYISISSDEDIQVIQTIDNEQIDRIKIGAIEKDNTGAPTAYGIYIKNKEGNKVFETDDDGNLIITGHIEAESGTFHGRVEAEEGYFTGHVEAESGSFHGHVEAESGSFHGHVEAESGSFAGLITANEGQIGGFNITDTSLYTGNIGTNNSVYVSTGYDSSVPIGSSDGVQRWAFTAGNKFGVTTDGQLYADDVIIRGDIQANNGSFTGTVYATGGEFRDTIIVGTQDKKYIVINSTNGKQPIIASSDYIHNSSTGWVIDGYGDATFNNISVRGAIKTAVFEYSEIQAVGGAFLFRPSSTIKTAIIDGNDIIVTVEQPSLFRQYEWVKLSNYKKESNTIINDGGLVTVYKIGSIDNENIRLLNAGNDFDNIKIDNTGDDDTSRVYDEYFVSLDTSVDNTKTYYVPSYELTEDTAFNYNKAYYQLIDGNYEIVTDIELDINPSEENYYEIQYHEVVNPTGNPQENEYYEKISQYVPQFDEQTYFAHLDETLEENKEYLLNFNHTKYIKQAVKEQVNIYDTDDEDEGELTYLIYIGNLGLLDSSCNNSGEPYVIYTRLKYDSTLEEEVADYTVVYSNELLETVKITEYIESKNDVSELVGGALISFGYEDALSNQGRLNYGIGINSSDNFVNLPARAISLFESKIHPNESVKVTYDWKGILGTLPPLGIDYANASVYQHMQGTQGIYTNNMYIGDQNQYVAFYTDSLSGEKKLRIKASQVVYEVFDPDTHQPTGEWNDINDTAGQPGPPGAPAIRVAVESSAGDIFRNRDINSVLTCTVYAGAEDITDQVTRFTWQKKNSDGTIDTSWSRLAAGRSITIGPSDIDSKAIFICTVEF